MEPTKIKQLLYIRLMWIKKRNNHPQEEAEAINAEYDKKFQAIRSTMTQEEIDKYWLSI